MRVGEDEGENGSISIKEINSNRERNTSFSLRYEAERLPQVVVSKIDEKKIKKQVSIIFFIHASDHM